MSALGYLDKLDAAIHADTTHEAAGTYTFAKAMTPWLREHGVNIVTVSDPQPLPVLASHMLDIPAFTRDPAAKQGMLMRQCTESWKVRPIRKYLQQHRARRRVEQWIGIGFEEVHRMKDSDVQYIYHRWPLIELHMTRADCIQWLTDHDLPIPPKSACVFCPYKSFDAWRDTKFNQPDDWAKAVEVDEAIRDVRQPYRLYIHRKRIPLTQVNLANATDAGQLDLWQNECTGLCGV